MSIFGGELGEDKTGKNRRGGTRGVQTPQGQTGTWVQVEGGEGGGEPAQER